jgi:hypothetical protein
VGIVFDPVVVSYKALLDIFWDIHDPTQEDSQGFIPDASTDRSSSGITKNRRCWHLRPVIMLLQAESMAAGPF